MVSICKRASPFNKSLDLKESIINCNFQANNCDYKNDFEYYEDSFYGTCVRFNSGKSMDGTTVPFKNVNNRGNATGLEMYIIADLSLRLWITNETVDLSQKQGQPIQSGSFLHQFEISKQTIIKQEKPYSDCLNCLDSIDSYNSELSKRTLKTYKQRYHYSNCLSLCKQKNIGEKCGIQVNWWGLKYFENMFTEIDYFSLLNGEHNKSKCYKTNANPSEDYLEKCNCPIECQKDEYTYLHSFGEVLNPRFKNYSYYLSARKKV